MTTAAVAVFVVKAADPALGRYSPSRRRSRGRGDDVLEDVQQGDRKYGLKDAGRSAGGAALAAARSSGRGEAAISLDLVTSFFAAQEEGIAAYDAELTNVINEQHEALLPLMATSEPGTTPGR